MNKCKLYKCNKWLFQNKIQHREFTTTFYNNVTTANDLLPGGGKDIAVTVVLNITFSSRKNKAFRLCLCTCIFFTDMINHYIVLCLDIFLTLE